MTFATLSVLKAWIHRDTFGWHLENTTGNETIFPGTTKLSKVSTAKYRLFSRRKRTISLTHGSWVITQNECSSTTRWCFWSIPTHTWKEGDTPRKYECGTFQNTTYSQVWFSTEWGMQQQTCWVWETILRSSNERTKAKLHNTLFITHWNRPEDNGQQEQSGIPPACNYILGNRKNKLINIWSSVFIPLFAGEGGVGKFSRLWCSISILL